MIYLDHNATSKIKPEIAEYMSQLMQNAYNPSSIHAIGREGRKIMEEAREKILKMLRLKNGDEYNVTFTASGTEANNLAINAYKSYAKIFSSTEHISVLKAAYKDENYILLPVSKQGIVELEVLEAMLSKLNRPAFVSVMLVNNETGIIQDISLIASLVHKYGGIIHTDAVQALGKMPIDMPNLGVDLLTISAHKAGGPLGVGCLISNKRCQIESMIKGGSQEMNRRAGTENVPAIAAFAKLTDYIEEEISKHQQVAKMREKMEEQISAYPGAKIVGQDAPRISNTSCIMMHNVPSQLQLMHFDLNNIALSAGAACSSGKISASHVLTSMGYSEQEASSAIRVSLGTNNTEAELESFISLWQEIYYKHETGLRGQK